ncbi:MAG: pantoate--beta-alanine ligase [Bacteroidetes bacterium]|nr:MAG: pantoate--beta-alanine ligase [Bacteroidota bacterium]
MRTLKRKGEIESLLENYRNNEKSIGFVPTMGALHRGHLSLIRKAKEENDICVCSIYVNPTQFNNPNDLEKYPRQLEEDIKLLENINCDILFAPDNEEMYPENEDEMSFNFGELENVMEGKYRPGHFMGVGTIVKKLLDIVKPNRAYFGKKDYQQLLIIRSVCEQYNIDTEIIGCEIIREEDGLAMSSRNKRLSPKQREEAPYIYSVLDYASIMGRRMQVTDLKDWVAKKISSNKEMELEYFEVCDANDLSIIKEWGYDQKVMGFIVVNMGDIRLIDNINI